MAQSGLFITLYDEETLELYLNTGIYGQHLSVTQAGEQPSSDFYGTLADYSCIRDGTHIFFFIGRKLYYGGEITGADEHGAFYLNGQTSELGRQADAPLVWDESERYIETGRPGKFFRDEPDEDDDNKEDGPDVYSQPFLIQFEPSELTGKYIFSDDFYVKVSRYPNMIPGNSISGVGFCTLTPGGTDHLLQLMESSPRGSVEPETDEDTSTIDLRDDREMIPFKPEYGISRASEANSELHLEGSLAANPELFPPDIRPEGDIICRQVPMVPPKPDLYKSDREDLCYYDSENLFQNGTVPNTIIELKSGTANYETAQQVVRYLRTMHAMFGDEADEIDLFVYADRFTDGTYTDKPFDDFISHYEDQVHKRIHDGHL